MIYQKRLIEEEEKIERSTEGAHQIGAMFSFPMLSRLFVLHYNLKLSGTAIVSIPYFFFFSCFLKNNDCFNMEIFYFLEVRQGLIVYHSQYLSR